GLNAVAAAVLFSAGTSMALGGVAQMLTPVPKTPTVGQTDNGKQNTYFSSQENMVAQGNPVPVLYGEMKIGSRVISQMMSTRDESTSGKVVVIGSPLQANTTSRQDGGITRPSVVIRQ
ncbi:tail assembly protein, partial [Salmonella enterica subsp. enterica serovar Typhimurium]|nr:tail assembly protein [Salmonella enterica subsp. enterica serovar Typhimurium]